MLNSGMLAGFFSPIAKDGWLSAFYWWQIPVLILLIAIIIFWVRYRKSQM